MTKLISAGLADLANRPHALYRFFDRADTLLYVGITADLSTRLGSHRREKPWAGQIAHIKVDYFPTRQGALVAEAKAIRDEHPLYNDQHNARALAPVVVIQGEPCGEECTEDCRYHHDRAACLLQNRLATDVIDQLEHLGDYNQRLAYASERAQQELLLPNDQRSFPDTDDVEMVAQSLLADALDDLRRFESITEQLLRRLKPEVRDQIEGAARHDWHCAGFEAPSRWDILPDIIRHLDYHLSGMPEREPQAAWWPDDDEAPV